MKPLLAAIKLLPVAALLTLLTACPPPLSLEVLDYAKDEVAPLITISSPAENSSFGRTILIQGMVTDEVSSKGGAGRVDALSYEILARTSPQNATLNPDGSFLITIDTNLTENIVIELKATDWNGNAATTRLPLVYEGNDIPSFQAVSGNREVILSWDPVPSVTSYTLYFEPSALAPTTASPGRVDNIASPYDLGNLKNGNLYSFLLRGHGSSGSDNYSEVKRAVPVSEFDLFPKVTPFFNQIRVDWRPYAGNLQYEVMRSTSPNGPFQSVSGPMSGSSYTDTSAIQRVAYYYGIKVATYSDTISQVAEGIADPFPTYLDAEIANYTSVTGPNATAVKGGYLYIADWGGGLRVASIAEPSTPVPITTIKPDNTFSSATDVIVDGDYLYLSHGDYLSVFDISSPADPVLLDTIQVTNSQAEGISVLDNWAFVACFNDGFAVVDISNKSNLPDPYHYDTIGNPDGLVQTYNMAAVDRSGTKILLVADNAKTLVYTVTGSASAPVLTKQSDSMSGADDVKILGNYAYLTSGWYLEVWDITTLTAPVKTDFLQPDTSEPVEALDVAAGRAYATIRDTGFSIIDVNDPANISLVRTYTTPGDARGITVADGYAYVADGVDYGVVIYGVASPDAPALADSYALSGPTNLAVYQDHVLVTETRNDWALTIVNATNPFNLTLAGATDSYTPQDLYVVGDYAVFAAERSGIMITDISTLSNPKVIPPWYVNLPGGYAIGIDVLGNYAFVSTAQSQLNVVDLSWDGNLNKVGSVATQGNPSYQAADVVVTRDYAFVANRLGGLRIVDIQDPKWPVALANFGATTGQAVAVALSGDYAFVADETNGLYVFDVSTPTSLVRYGPFGGAGALDVVVRGNFAYLANGAGGVQMMDITNPISPVTVLSFSTPSPATRVAVNREFLYVFGTDVVYAYNLMQ
ncbi:MAG: hypothetical protein JSV89_11850 [Spirochaetaceae bacterium]|nr:MAG: hypothetical protein JSV89_11850 [Spirochaetaceae bacterium]